MIRKIIIFSLLVLIGVSFAHGDKKHKAKIDSKTKIEHSNLSSVHDTTQNNHVHSESTLEEEEEHSHGEEFNLIDSLFEHIHNKLIHFPIVIGLLGFIFGLMNIKNNKFEQTLKIIIPVGFVFSVISVITGLIQANNFVDVYYYWAVELHEYFAISVTILFAVWSFILFNTKLKKYGWMVGILMIILISVTGWLGGAIAH